MAKNREKFNSLVSKENTDTVTRNKERIKNRARLRESQQIALKVLNKLDELNWSQRKLAQEMGVKPQQITKIVKGTENLTLETQVRLQDILDIPILATFYERKVEEMISAIKIEKSYNYTLPEFKIVPDRLVGSKEDFQLENDYAEPHYETYSMIA